MPEDAEDDEDCAVKPVMCVAKGENVVLVGEAGDAMVSALSSSWGDCWVGISTAEKRRLTSAIEEEVGTSVVENLRVISAIEGDLAVSVMDNRRFKSEIDGDLTDSATGRRLFTSARDWD